jgi:hypothetical protein
MSRLAAALVCFYLLFCILNSGFVEGLRQKVPRSSLSRNGPLFNSALLNLDSLDKFNNLYRNGPKTEAHFTGKSPNGYVD